MTREQYDALEETIGIALDDERNYFNVGCADDYGDEWPEVARNKARRWRHIAEGDNDNAESKI